MYILILKYRVNQTGNIEILIFKKDSITEKAVLFNLLAPELFFLILAHSLYKMLIIQEPNMLEL